MQERERAEKASLLGGHRCYQVLFIVERRVHVVVVKRMSICPSSEVLENEDEELRRKLPGSWGCIRRCVWRRRD